MKKRINILSDLHLEFSNFNLTKEKYDVLVLAGDISQDLGSLYNFFNKSLKEDIPVIYVLGNHEFEGKRFPKVFEECKNIEKDFPNVHILYNKAVDVSGVRFIGTTLWSNFESNGLEWKDKVKSWAKQNVIDFSYIFKENTEGYDLKYRAWTPDDMEKEFNKAYSFLEYELKKNITDLPKVVVTHFAPHKKSIHEKYSKDVGSSYWANNLEELMGFSEYWIHGHTHDSFNYEVSGTKVLCNPRGISKTYDLTSNTDFNRDMIIEIDCKLENSSEPNRKIRP